jgi:hypothetical protein
MVDGDPDDVEIDPSAAVSLVWLGLVEDASWEVDTGGQHDVGGGVVGKDVRFKYELSSKLVGALQVVFSDPLKVLVV